MKRVQVALIAEGVAKLVGARAHVNALHAAIVTVYSTIDKALPLAMKQVQSQLAEQNIVLHPVYSPACCGPDYDRLPEEWVQEARPAVLAQIDAADKNLIEAGLSPRFDQRLSRIRDAVKADPLVAPTVRLLLDELAADVLAELAEPTFLRLPDGAGTLYRSEDAFGVEVAAEFPDADRDVAGAARCLAVGEWTACVFHSMRVLEHGLRMLAQGFNVPFGQDSWGRVIDAIEKGIQALRTKPGLSEQDRRAITAYSEAATQFRYFKDAWRNHVAHAREHYDEREAERVFNHVRDFMQDLVKVKGL